MNVTNFETTNNYGTQMVNRGIVILPSVEDAMKLKERAEEFKREAKERASKQAAQQNAEYTEFEEVGTKAPSSNNPEEVIPTEVELMRSNTVFVNSINKRYVQFQKLWLFIRDYFVTRVPGKYEWFALFAFLYKKGYIALDDKIKFSSQMCSTEWFGHINDKNKPTADAIGDYNYLLEVDYMKWKSTPIPMGNRVANATGLSKIVNDYINLDTNYNEDDILEPRRQ